jgi:hypothetical protein
MTAIHYHFAMVRHPSYPSVGRPLAEKFGFIGGIGGRRIFEFDPGVTGVGDMTNRIPNRGRLGLGLEV